MALTISLSTIEIKTLVLLLLRYYTWKWKNLLWTTEADNFIVYLSFVTYKINPSHWTEISCIGILFKISISIKVEYFLTITTFLAFYCIHGIKML